MGRTLVVGDIHGGYKALLQVLERSGFSDDDTLIGIGDYVDGWSETKQVVELLSGLDNFIGVIGNHDVWFLDWLRSGRIESIWYNQGGKETLRSYGYTESDINMYGFLGVAFTNKVPDHHIKFFNDLYAYYEYEDKLFVHGGFNPKIPIEKQDHESLTWNRSLWHNARDAHRSQIKQDIDPRPRTKYEEVYIGHTSTAGQGQYEPVKYCEIWNIDQGAGWHGKLTLMDVETHEYWQSDFTSDLYPLEKGRR